MASLRMYNRRKGPNCLDEKKTMAHLRENYIPQRTKKKKKKKKKLPLPKWTHLSDKKFVQVVKVYVIDFKILAREAVKNIIYVSK